MKPVLQLLGLAAILLGASSASSAVPGVVGDWRNEAGDAVIRVSIAKDGTLVGVGARGGDDDKERFDVKNPDPKLKGRSLLGAPIMWGFTPDNEAKTRWSGGKIYDPDNGKTYSCKLELKEGRLRIRGYVGISLFGRTTVWTRNKEAQSDSR